MYPIQFHPKKDEILREMEERGRRFLFSGEFATQHDRTNILYAHANKDQYVNLSKIPEEAR